MSWAARPAGSFQNLMVENRVLPGMICSGGSACLRKSGMRWRRSPCGWRQSLLTSLSPSRNERIWKCINQMQLQCAKFYVAIAIHSEKAFLCSISGGKLQTTFVAKMSYVVNMCFLKDF